MERLAILDRDGTINIDYGFVYRWEDWQFSPRAIDALDLLQQSGYHLLVVSNQSGIGRGYYTVDDVERLHQRVAAELRSRNIYIHAFLYCPHAPENDCRCRKPSPQLVLSYVKSRNLLVDWSASWTIGDKLSDFQLGQQLGTRTVLLESTYWDRAQLDLQPAIIAGSLFDAVWHILERSGNREDPRAAQ